MNISPGEIHVWYAFDEDISDPELIARYFDIMNTEERIQQKRFHFERHRHQYLITRALIRSVLSMYVKKVAPQQWQFEKNDYGKPSISYPSIDIPLMFNLSHTEKLIVLCVSVDNEPGIDVEYLLRSGQTIEIAEHFFSPTEIEHLHRLPPDYKRERFFDLWTLKEAYIKACGMGLSIPLDDFSYIFPQPGRISIAFEPQRNDQPEHWQFWQVQPSEIHKVALAIKSSNRNNLYSLSMRTITPLSHFVDAKYPITARSLKAGPV